MSGWAPYPCIGYLILIFMGRVKCSDPPEGINILPRRPEWARAAGINNLLGVGALNSPHKNWVSGWALLHRAWVAHLIL
jgi:hypothetical protein